MARRVIVPRLPEGAVPPSDGSTRLVDPPALTGLRMVFGVGPSSSVAPTDETFKPTYEVGMPVFSLGGLDPDGVHEFDAAALLDVIRRRSLRRQWGLRLELELMQSADTVAAADIFVQTPFSDEPDQPTMTVIGRTGRGTTLSGGGRTVVLATSIVHDSKRAQLLGGIYSIQLRDTDPDSDDKPNVASVARGVNVDLTRFEFEG
jgi:hypothetical protein